MGVKTPQKAYIAGKITNDPQYREKFAKAVKYLTGIGYAVMSPATMEDGFDYEDYMHVCFAMMWVCRAGTAFFLPDWESSPGAIREHENARKTGMEVEYLSWEDIGWGVKPPPTPRPSPGIKSQGPGL